MPSTGPEPVSSSPVEVSVGLILDPHGRVLVTRRQGARHLAGLWEFPGGKVAAGESPATALARELEEELGLAVASADQCLTIEHAYAERAVRLHVFRVYAWSGVPRGREGQPMEWRAPAELDPTAFPAANRAMLHALRLPASYLITPSPANAAQAAPLEQRVVQALRAGRAGMVQVRAPDLGEDDYRDFLAAIAGPARDLGIPVLANAPPEWLAGFPEVGLHLPERRWRGLDERPATGGWVAASVHDRSGLHRAAALGLDFAVLGPVCPTATHPGAEALGWERFAAWVRGAAIPVYALGGMSPDTLAPARAAGAQGIAAIRGLLD
ncbi:Nudix family hydrolase [Thioalkalivibrio sp. AKL19]|uniref:Nudix family hydrolase n=1 Tax=Thioalkalivibrio sp. AKL19 TaxID=1266914 RepID=UPI000462A420|nr:Nudix family hydrolase [Thioalkalivibrio sp. AKL19]